MARGRRGAGRPGTPEWKDRVTSDPRVCGGVPCIAGTRVFVSVILDNLAAGVPVDEILVSYPSLEPEDVRAALGYAAELARGRSLSA